MVQLSDESRRTIKRQVTTFGGNPHLTGLVEILAFGVFKPTSENLAVLASKLHDVSAPPITSSSIG